MSYRSHTCGQLTKDNLDQEVTLSGWINSTRDHGGVIFIDLRDIYGFTQVKADPKTTAEDVMSVAHKLKDEYVIKVTWKVIQRPEWTENSELTTWEIEVVPSDIQIISESEHPPFEVANEHHVWEELRMQYRYLDMRRQTMQQNIVARHKVFSQMFNFLSQRDFLYLETPELIKNTPEWAREFIVPSRNYEGKSYVLPQSPQQVKQLLMVSGFDRYFQLAKCFRDEDLRWDRQPEFTQLDLEACFVEQEDVMNIIEDMMKDIVKNSYSYKTLQSDPFSRITWKEAMDTYGNDSPELRTKEFSFVDISDIARESDLKVFRDVVDQWWVVKWFVVDKIFTRWEIDKYTEKLQEKWAKGLAYIVWDEEWPKSPILKFFSEEQQQQIFERIRAKQWTTSFFQATDWLDANSLLGYLRDMLVKDLNMTAWKEDELSFYWVTDFPLFEIDEDTGKLASPHHPFTMPKEEDIPVVKELGKKVQQWEKLSQEDKEKLLKIKSQSYDLVLNGYEIWGGSIRIADQELQNAIFSLLGMSEEVIQQRFGHMTKAFQYWVPPHGWLAIGFDRLVMILQNMPNIREVIPFPKTQKWEDLMLGTPTDIDDDLLKELKLKITE